MSLKEYGESYKEPLSGYEDHRVELPKTFKIISCPNCSNEIPAANLNLSNKIGKCGSCHGVFSIEEDIKSLQTARQKIKQEILRPEGIELFHFQDELEISFEQPMTWLEWPFIFLLMILMMTGIGISIESSGIIPFFTLTVVPLLLSLLYFRRKKAKHRIVLSMDEQFLNISWRPKKFHADQKYDLDDIQQLYVRKLDSWYIYMIVDQGNGQKHIKLTSLNTPSKAKYLEQEMESYLNIQDVVVPEET